PGLEVDERSPRRIYQVRVQAQAQPWQVTYQASSLLARRHVHQQASARQQAAPVRLRDATVDSRARAQIVTVHNNALHTGTSGDAQRGQSAGSTDSNQVSISARVSNAHSACACTASIQGQMRQLAMREISAVSSSRLRSLVAGVRQPSGATA